jgi:hypothetical protein
MNTIVDDLLCGETVSLKQALAGKRTPGMLATTSLRSIERARYALVRGRDGPSKARAYARQCVSVYLRAIKARRAKRGLRFAYRREYILAAASFRLLLREDPE